MTKGTANKMKLSIVIPVYNEEKTLREILQKVEEVKLDNFEKEIIIVDDCSKDNSRKILQELAKKKSYKIIFHSKNQGKGAALRTGFSRATGDVILIQDADLEYDPNDYPKLLQPIIEGEAEVVYGSRFKSKKGKLREHSFTYLMHSIGNAGLTIITNILYFSKLTDMETCYKAFTRRALEQIGPLRARRFDFEPEITAKFLKNGFRIKEVPINYYSRDFNEGKKITWKDGLKAALYLIKYRFTN